MTKLFFATVQNKMHYAVHEHTAAELIYERVDNEKPFVGMTNFKGNYVSKRLNGSLKSIVNAKCDYWRATSIKP